MVFTQSCTHYTTMGNCLNCNRVAPYISGENTTVRAKYLNEVCLAFTAYVLLRKGDDKSDPIGVPLDNDKDHDPVGFLVKYIKNAYVDPRFKNYVDREYVVAKLQKMIDGVVGA